MPRKSTSPKAARPIQVESTDRTLMFVMRRTARGVHVVRRQSEQGHHDGLTVFFSVSALFSTREQFAKFCAADTMQSRYPVTYQQLRTSFHELMRSDG